MGSRAERYFRDAERLGGVSAKVKLAALARLASTEATALPDSVEVVERLANAYERVREELMSRRPDVGWNARPSIDPLAAQSSLPPPSHGALARVRQHMSTVLDLVSQRAVIFADRPHTMRRVVEAASSSLQVGRASVWLLEDRGSALVCSTLFDTSKRVHQQGMRLLAVEHAPYFAALATERSIAAVDARRDPRTRSFAEGYLIPEGIGAMLDVPLWVRGRMIGVLCHEHVGGTRAWEADDERCANLLSGLLAMALEANGS
jgi:hypothetical protein